ncbi:MAG: hypothetical protein DVB28_000830 [Verrucomicrobia bacterium]|nr:MAG: hypothetical protein DVB28_000830 [Verrucomicrobiota bacterium]
MNGRPPFPALLLVLFLGLVFSGHGRAHEEDDEADCPCASNPDASTQTSPHQLFKNISGGGRGAPQSTGPRARVLILGDSLGLCGFGKTLDSKLRKAPGVGGVYTYLACGTVPLSWLKTGALAKAHTGCGFWTIEGKSGEHPAEFQDTFGMQRGKRPDSHAVPKLETLLEEHHPDILVIQNGTNLLSLFGDGKTILPHRHDSQIRSYLNPMMQLLAQKAPSLKKVYWVGPPVSGRVTADVQDFLLHRLASYECAFLNVIDSRGLIRHPYRNTMPDKEHFIGRDMDAWAEGVFQHISKDLSEGLLSAAPLSRSALLPAAAKTAGKSDAPPPKQRARLVVSAKLIAKSEPLPLEKLQPYQESMVSFVYHVDEVLAGEYLDAEIVVMHPAHIRLKAEPLGSYKLGSSYKLELLDFDGSPWEAIKRSEDTGRIELRPFIRKEDEARFPSLAR